VKKLMRFLRNDDGIGLIEVLVALMIFSIIAVGMAYSMISMSRLTADSTMRETATNLAAAEIDRIQSLPDPFTVHSEDSPTATMVDGVPFSVMRHVKWVSTTGASGACGSGGGNLQYKQVNVTVTWPDMYLSEPVHADSALAPSSRINDPSYGVVLVSVLGIDGDGRSGVTVRVTPESGGGGTAITDTIDATDVDGCTYVIKVAPGKYKIEIEKTGYVDSNQIAVPSYTEQVIEAGTTTTASFQYENAGTFTLKYAATSTLTPSLPSNLDTTYIGGLVNHVKTGIASSIKLHPFPSGYQAVAGESDVCLNVDPEKWTENSTMADGVRPTAVAAGPGAAADLSVPMGVFTFDIPDSNSKRYVTAVQQETTASSGNPGCADGTTYSWSTRFARDSRVTLALPYGSWIFYTGNTAGAKTYSVSSGVAPVDGVVKLDASGDLVKGILGNSKFTSGVLTLDPRQVKP
jgi:type II secretory pathway pseudopilin PulG